MNRIVLRICYGRNGHDTYYNAVYMSGKWNVEWVGAVRALINPSLPQILAEVLSPASP